MTDTLMVGVSGVRGIVGKDLTPEVVTRWARAFGTFAREGTRDAGRGTGPSVVVGRDARTSGPAFAAAVTAGPLSPRAGADSGEPRRPRGTGAALGRGRGHRRGSGRRSPRDRGRDRDGNRRGLHARVCHTGGAGRETGNGKRETRRGLQPVDEP